MLRLPTVTLLALACCFAQDDKPAPAIPDLEAAAQTTYLHGDYEAAHQTLLQAWTAAQLLPPSDPVRYDVLKRLSSVRAAAGEFADADNYLQLAISWLETNNGQDDPKLPGDFLIAVDYARARKEYDQALAILNRVISLHIRAVRRDDLTPPMSIAMADDFSRRGQIQAEMKDVESAIGSLQTALTMRGKLLGEGDASLVYDLDRLGTLQISQRAYDKAEETYRHALVIRETLYGKVHADLIATVDGLAYSFFGQKKYDDAEQAYQRLLALWISSVGDSRHPMVALALDKIAIFYATQKKWDEASEALTRANAVRASLLATGLSDEASQHIDQGKWADAVPPYQRALKVLDIPNPVYDEQRAQIEAAEKELEKLVKKPPSPAPPRAGSKK